MGTRSITVVKLDGETRVSQYGQFDGYPTYAGRVVLTFARDIHNVGELAFRIKRGSVNFLTDDQEQKLQDALEDMPDDVVEILSAKSPLLREWGPNILHQLTRGPLLAYLREEDAENPNPDIEAIYTLEIDSKGMDEYDLHLNPETIDFKVRMRYHGCERTYGREQIASMTDDDIKSEMKRFEAKADER